MNKKITKKFILKSLLALISLICFIIITKKIFNEEILQIDIKSYEFISKYLISNKITPITLVITNFGSSFILIGIALALLIIIKNKKIGISTSFNLAFIALLNIILKNIVGRPRPSGYEIITETGYSFPSGHSMISAAFYGYLIYLIYKYIKNKKVKYTLIVLLSLLVFMIGISRVYLGVHYISDVIGGFLISATYLVVYTSFTKRYIGGKNEVNK